MLKTYRTVGGQGQSTQVAKRSRFIAQTAAIQSVEEADAFIARVRQQHDDANHHVYAYVIGLDSLVQKYSDDGEPSATAGLPVLEVIRHLDLTDVVVVVTRYFGGTLLGRGGLIRAYGGTAKQAVLAAGVVERIPHWRVHVMVDYALSGKIENELRTTRTIVEDTVYQEDVTFQLLVREKDLESLQAHLQELTADRFQWSTRSQCYVNRMVAMDDEH